MIGNIVTFTENGYKCKGIVQRQSVDHLLVIKITEVSGTVEQMLGALGTDKLPRGLVTKHLFEID